MHTAILRPRDAARYLGTSVSTLYRWQRELPDFPKLIKLGRQASGWRKADLDAWIESRSPEGRAA